MNDREAMQIEARMLDAIRAARERTGDANLFAHYERRLLDRRLHYLDSEIEAESPAELRLTIGPYSRRVIERLGRDLELFLRAWLHLRAGEDSP